MCASIAEMPLASVNENRAAMARPTRVFLDALDAGDDEMRTESTRSP
jgi:hypothetical protein